jgi:hypothetical protein
MYRASNEKEALRQGEILTGIIQFVPIPAESSSDEKNIQFKSILHPYAIIITQDCDLDWDYTARQSGGKANKLLNSVIFCEVYTAEDIRYDKNREMNSSEWNLVKTNRHQQYHFFEKVPSDCDLTEKGLPELTVDFKKVFAIDAEYLYHQISSRIARRLTLLECRYLEHFSHRYHDYHGRVALPAQYQSEKGGS